MQIVYVGPKVYQDIMETLNWAWDYGKKSDLFRASSSLNAKAVHGYLEAQRMIAGSIKNIKEVDFSDV